jgi:Uma2 family endonuclease
LPDVVYVDTAIIVVEILSPDDEAYEKMPFYAGRGVDELVIVDPVQQKVRTFALQGDRYAENERSRLLVVEARTLERAIDWP